MLPESPEERLAALRAELIAEIEPRLRRSLEQAGQDLPTDAVLEAMARVPRHEFVPQPWRRDAYDNVPLPIGNGQTISQPFIVALMTALAKLGPESRVLEVGTGSGYQAAILAELAHEVFTIEVIDELGQQAADVLQHLGYSNVRTRIGNGYGGWPEAAPFDAIVVTAAPPELPEALVAQLACGGRLVIPVGPGPNAQELCVLDKDATGRVQSTEVLPVRFVPLVAD